MLLKCLGMRETGMDASEMCGCGGETGVCLIRDEVELRILEVAPDVF
jgi:hypothetical protein